MVCCAGLFHKAISQSGVIYNPWAVIRNTKERAYELCDILENPLKDPKAIVNFLKTVDCKKLLEAQIKISKAIVSMVSTYHASVQ